MGKSSPLLFKVLTFIKREMQQSHYLSKDEIFIDAILNSIYRLGESRTTQFGWVFLLKRRYNAYEKLLAAKWTFAKVGSWLVSLFSNLIYESFFPKLAPTLEFATNFLSESQSNISNSHT